MCSVSINRALLVSRGCIGDGELQAPSGHSGLDCCTPGRPWCPSQQGARPSLHTRPWFTGWLWSHCPSVYPVPEIPVVSAPHLRSLVELLSNNQHQKEPPGFKYSKILNFWPHTWAVNALLRLCIPPVPLLPSVFWVWFCGHVDQVGFCISFFSDTF